MGDVPVTRYVRVSDGGTVAYQVSGGGPVDLLMLGGASVPVDLLSDEPSLVRARGRLNAFTRNVWLEQRGFGSSDRDISPERGADEDVGNEQITAVAEALGSETFALMASGMMGPWALRYAAAHPERVSALVLFDSFASYVQDAECPWGLPIDVIEGMPAWAAESWGTGAQVDLVAPSRKTDDRLREWFAHGQRLGATPSYAGERLRARFLQDTRDRLSAIRVPTLIVHRQDDRMINVAAGRYLAEHISGARYVELPGADNLFFVGDADAVIDEIEEFLTGRRTGGEGDVIVSTVLFTDIVDSTRQAADLGHRAWSNLAQEHDTRVRHALDRHRGREIKTMGDGFLATFDSAGRAMRCATEIVRDARGIGLEVRAGIHTGEVEFRDDDVTGLAVTIGKRVCDLAAGGQILVTESVRGATIGTTIELDDAGVQALKGVPATVHLFSVKP